MLFLFLLDDIVRRWTRAFKPEPHKQHSRIKEANKSQTIKIKKTKHNIVKKLQTNSPI